MATEIQPTGLFEKRELSRPGSISAGLMEHLAQNFPPDLIAKKIAELLDATHVTAGNREIADNRAREAGLKLLLGYLIGLPVQRQEILTKNVQTLDDFKARAKGSPAVKQSLRKLLAELEADSSTNTLDAGTPGAE